MHCFPYTDVEDEFVELEGAQGVTVRWLLTDAQGARNFHMRRFTVAPGGCTPRHAHGFEHEVYVLEGKGELWDGPAGQWRPLKPGDVVLAPADEEHQFRAADDEGLVFLCLIPGAEVCAR